MIYLNVPTYPEHMIEEKYFSLDECLANSDHFAHHVYSEEWYHALSAIGGEFHPRYSFDSERALCAPKSVRTADLDYPLWIVPTGEGNDEIFQEIFFRRFWPTYADACIGSLCGCGNHATELEEQNEVYLSWWKEDFIPLFVNTWDKYTKLIKLYKEKENDLLDQVKTSSRSLNTFSDTPQSEADTDLWTDMEHTSTAGKNQQEGATDFSTPIERLDEIRRKLEDIYADWVLELGRCFIRRPLA